MKKKLFILSTIACIALSACSGNGKSSGNNDEATTTDSVTGTPDDTLTNDSAGTDPNAGRTSPDEITPNGSNSAKPGGGNKTGTESNKQEYN